MPTNSMIQPIMISSLTLWFALWSRQATNLGRMGLFRVAREHRSQFKPPRNPQATLSHMGHERHIDRHDATGYCYMLSIKGQVATCVQ